MSSPLPRWSPRAVRTSHQMDRSESPCTHVAGVQLLEPGCTVTGPTIHLAGLWFRSSSITSCSRERMGLARGRASFSRCPLETPTPWRETAPIHGVRALDRCAVPVAHPAVQIATIVLRAAASARLVARRWSSAARAEPRGSVLPPPDRRAPVEAPAAIDAVVIGHDVPGRRAVRALAALWVRQLRREHTARPRRRWGACRPHDHMWACAVHHCPSVCHIICGSDGTSLQPSVVRPHASLAASARKPTARCGPESTGDERAQEGSSAEAMNGDLSESAPHPRPRPTGRYRESTTRPPVCARELVADSRPRMTPWGPLHMILRGA